jgi:hypothetical protein
MRHRDRSVRVDARDLARPLFDGPTLAAPEAWANSGESTDKAGLLSNGLTPRLSVSPPSHSCQQGKSSLSACLSIC